MNRKLLLNRLRGALMLLAAISIASISRSQTANQYSAAFSTGASLITQTSPTTLLTAPNDDNVSTTAQAIGFNFAYEGVTYTHFIVSPDGFIKLVTSSSGTGSNQFSNATTSTTNTPKLMVFWDDLALGSSAGGGYVKYSLEGSSPNQQAVIEWYVTIPRTTTGTANTKFQAVLNQNGNTIDYIYGGTAGTGTMSASVGLGGATATNFLSVTFGTTNTTSSTTANDAISAYPASGTKITFTPPPLCSGTPTTGTITASSNPVCAGNSATLTLSGTTVAVGIGIQWLSSTDNITFTPVAGGTTSSITVSPLATTYYKATVTCNSASPASTGTTTLTVSNPPTTATLPFTESFESWISACGTNDRPGINWLTNPASGNNAWRRDDEGSTASWTSATLGGFSPVFTTGAHSARFHSRNASAGQMGTMDAYVNMSPAGNKFITFDYVNTSGSDSLYVELSTNGGLTFTTLGFVTIASSWTPQTFVTTSTASNAVVRLRARADFGSTDISVDNFRVVVSNCFPPTALTAGSLTPTTASLGYTPTGTPVAYQIEYGSSTFTLGTGTRINTTATSATAGGLTGGNSYSFFVRAICGPGDTSSFSSRFVYTTPCAAVTLPYSEQFVTYLPNNCWYEATGQLTSSATLTGTSSAWGTSAYLNGASSNQAARINLFSNTKKDWLVTPPVNLIARPAGTNYVMEFNAGFVDYLGTVPAKMGSDDTVAVVVSTDNGLTWSKSNIIQLFTAANTPVGGTTGGQRYTLSLDGYTGMIRIGFYGSEGTINDAPDYDVFIDSILIRTCIGPVNALGNDTILCPAATITLDAGNPGSTYLYSNNATTRTTPVTSAGTYTVRITDANACVVRDTIVVAAGADPVVNLGNDTVICPAATITLDAGNPGSTYLYSNNTTARTLSITSGGIYSVAVTNSNKCVGRDTIVITQGQNPVVNLGRDTAVCPGAATTLVLDAGNPGSTYRYNTSATTQTISVTSAGTYSVEVTDANKCTGRDTIIVVSGVNPTVNLGNDTTICPGTVITLNAGNPGSRYLYSNSATTQTTGITTGGAYNVRVTNAQGCIGRDTIIVAQGINPLVRLGNDTAFCPGGSIFLNAGNPGSSYLYSTGATTQSITVASAGTYSVRVTNAQKCVGRDTIVIAAAANPVVNLGRDTTLCPGRTIVLNAGNAGSSYLYSTGATTQTLTVTAAGTYSVRVTSPQKCIGRDTIVIGAGTNPVVDLGPDTSVCDQVAYTLDAGNPGATYLYNTGAITRTLSVIPAGTYSVQVTTGQGCVGYDTVNISVIPLPSVSDIIVVKTGTTVAFSSNATNTTGYLWYFGDNTTATTASPSHTYTRDGIYTVALLVSNQCGVDTLRTSVTITGLGAGQAGIQPGAFRLYPNPATSVVSIDNGSTLKMRSVTVLNSLGAVVLRREGIDPQKEALDISMLPAGSYMVRIGTDGGTVIQQMQVRK